MNTVVDGVIVAGAIAATAVVAAVKLIAAKEAAGWLPYGLESLLRLALLLVPPPHRERYEREWLGELAATKDRPLTAGVVFIGEVAWRGLALRRSLHRKSQAAKQAELDADAAKRLAIATTVHGAAVRAVLRDSPIAWLHQVPEDREDVRSAIISDYRTNLLEDFAQATASAPDVGDLLGDVFEAHFDALLLNDSRAPYQMGSTLPFVWGTSMQATDWEPLVACHTVDRVLRKTRPRSLFRSVHRHGRALCQATPTGPLLLAVAEVSVPEIAELAGVSRATARRILRRARRRLATRIKTTVAASAAGAFMLVQPTRVCGYPHTPSYSVRYSGDARAAADSDRRWLWRFETASRRYGDGVAQPPA
jgi:hypothetical protein